MGICTILSGGRFHRPRESTPFPPQPPPDREPASEARPDLGKHRVKRSSSVSSVLFSDHLLTRKYLKCSRRPQKTGKVPSSGAFTKRRFKPKTYLTSERTKSEGTGREASSPQTWPPGVSSREEGRGRHRGRKADADSPSGYTEHLRVHFRVNWD